MFAYLHLLWKCVGIYMHIVTKRRKFYMLFNANTVTVSRS